MPNGVIASFRNTELDIRTFAPNLEQGLSAAVSREHIAEAGTALSSLLGLFLEARELSEAAGDFEVRRALAAIAGGVRDREVVFSVETLLD
jgi:hypothetical protein